MFEESVFINHVIMLLQGPEWRACMDVDVGCNSKDRTGEATDLALAEIEFCGSHAVRKTRLTVSGPFDKTT